MGKETEQQLCKMKIGKGIEYFMENRESNTRNES